MRFKVIEIEIEQREEKDDTDQTDTNSVIDTGLDMMRTAKG